MIKRSVKVLEDNTTDDTNMPWGPYRCILPGKGTFDGIWNWDSAFHAMADWTWFKSAEKFDDAEIASLVYPRDLCIRIGSRDELFDYKYGEESFEKLKEICKEVGTDWVSFMVFDGVHEFCIDDEPIKKLISRLM